MVNSLKAGLDLEMPSSDGISSKKIVEAVLNGELEETILNKAVENILNIVFKVNKNKENVKLSGVKDKTRQPLKKP